MGFNVVDIIILLIILLSCYFAYKKGFLLTLYKITSLFLSIWLAWIFNPIMKELIIKYTNLEVWFSDKIKGGLKTIITESIENGTLEEKEDAIGKLNIPGMLKESLIEQVENSNVENNFATFITEKLTDVCLNVLAFILVIIVVVIVLALLKGVLKLISSIPVIEEINKLLGIVLGIALACMRIWIILLIIGLIVNVDSSGFLIGQINGSFLGNLFYQNNLISYIILKLIA